MCWSRAAPLVPLRRQRSRHPDGRLVHDGERRRSLLHHGAGRHGAQVGALLAPPSLLIAIGVRRMGGQDSNSAC